jgi:hypothetical protein
MAVGFSLPTAPGDLPSDLAAADLAGADLSSRLPAGVDPADSSPRPDFAPEAEAAQPLPEKAELMDEIAREAARKQEEQGRMHELKDRAQAEIQAESERRVEDERVAFRRELKEIVKAGGKQAGQQIDALCNRYGRNYDPALRARVRYILSHTNGRVSKEARVRQLRGCGVPEAGILDYLANDLHRYINSRKGLRDPNDVRVSAARQLLGFRLDPDGDMGPKGSQARADRLSPANPPGNSPAR